MAGPFGNKQIIVHPGGPSPALDGIRIRSEVNTTTPPGGGTTQQVLLEIEPHDVDFEIALQSGGTVLLESGTSYGFSVADMSASTPSVMYAGPNGNRQVVSTLAGGSQTTPDPITVGAGYLPVDSESLDDIEEVHVVLTATQRLLRLKLKRAGE